MLFANESDFKLDVLIEEKILWDTREMREDRVEE